MFSRYTRRLLMALIALAALLPTPGCGCRRCCGTSNSFAPPPGPCCDKNLPPPNVVPGVVP
jgi:hypothetical protein